MKPRIRVNLDQAVRFTMKTILQPGDTEMTSLSQHIDVNHMSRDADFAENVMSGICGQHYLDKSYSGTLDFHYDGIRLPHNKMTIGMVSYGANVAINIAELKAYSISLPLYGQQTLNMHGVQYRSNQDQGLIVSNREQQNLIINKDCKKIHVVIPESSLNKVLSDLLNQPIQDQIIFNPEMQIHSTQLIDAWWKNIQSFLAQKSQYMGFYGLGMLSGDYENFLIKALLLSQENNYSSALKMATEQQMPEYIRHVQQYLIQHARESISAEDLQRVAGVSKSKLYQEFQYYFATSPMSYLKRYRLQQIFKALTAKQGQRNLSISQLAYEWGFNHLSRFSQEYRAEFGESPSDTKNRS